MKGLVSMLVLALGCSSSSESAADEGPCAGFGESDCATTSGCHLIFSAEEPCDNLCCASHFDRCEDGAAATCGNPSGACDVSCTQTPSSCQGGFVQSFTADGCCPDGCAAMSQCAGVTITPAAQCPSGNQDTLHVGGSDLTACDLGDLSHSGVQGCPTS
jgi:hypothetical protein